MSKEPQTLAPLTELIHKRWSPRSFDESFEISDQDLLSILEAGRWAPSAMNAQPWRFSVGRRGTQLHESISSALSGFNKAWAPRASVLIVVSVKKDEAGNSSKRNFYDAGLAVSLMAMQAMALDLYSHQMSGIEFDTMAEILEIPSDFEVAVAIAIGKKDSPEKLAEPAFQREIAPRERLSLDEIVLHGKP